MQLNFSVEDERWVLTIVGNKGTVHLPVEEEELYEIRGMLLEFAEGLFHGIVEKILYSNGESVGNTIVYTGITFTPTEMQDILQSEELFKLGGLLDGWE